MDGTRSGGGTPGQPVTWRVEGMDCASCVAKVEKAVGRLPGVTDIKINLMAERLGATLAPGGATPEAVEKQIGALGYKVTRLEALAASPPLSWRVEGMDCASCVAKVEKAVGRLPGVSDVSVNLMTERLTLRLAPGTTDAAAVEKQIGALGYKAKALAPQEAPGAPPASAVDHDHGHCRGHDHGHHDHDHGHAGHGHAQAQPAGAQPHAAHDHDHGHAHGAAFGHSHADHDDPADATKPWYATGKARLVWLLGALVIGAYALSLVLPRNLTYPLFLIATLVALVPFGRRAFNLARAGSPFSIETLMVTAAAGAAVIGAAEEAAVVVLLFALGELLENVAAGRARAGIKALANLMPRTALRLRADGSTEQVPSDRLSVGDLVLVRPGDRVPGDGTIEEGQSALDESPVTGESVPVTRGPGDAVVAGSINADGALRVRVSRAATDNTIARIIRMVEEATASRAPTQRFIERFSTYWTPGAMVVSALVILLPPFLLGWDWWTSVYRGLAVLLIACPCALVISVPAALASGLSAGARRGLLIKGGAALEAIGAARTVAFDKTGTLTAGHPKVTDVLPVAGTSAWDLLAYAAAVEQGSSHPLAKAVLAEASERGIATPQASDQGAVPGKAVTATVGGRKVSIGSPRHAAELGANMGALAEQVSKLETEGKTAVVVVVDGAAAGVLALRDEPRADAAAGVAALSKLGIRSVMLTGDNARTGAAIAGGLGLDVKAELLPEDKLREIGALREAGSVVMVGDGINDAPALAAASVGVAMGGGTDVALETADAAVLKDRVSGVAELVGLSRSTMTNVKTNVAIAVGLKAVFLVTTLIGVTGLWPAIMADTGATVLVTLNALRLLAWKPGV
ncbi:heavy metal translocating P-type ATPase [Pseudoroseomonas rhizosphaerae]|uniref:P-type Zn(2+) transporter n=1 Tax=Teichococcus rhizosphaerae TaxID=1335062 RepID=A0A2C7A8Y8_9PROT|nr:heavy metal translocating P-type ATPase [Pseudoroseomonas rhizosphaerae]PHK94093.1 heavy metal translocating P-type ATPase [Pseudoroseomonas rhizosphaerae]